MPANHESRYQTIHAVVQRIPSGRVATYGQVARLAGFRGCARQVGYALHALADSSDVPWHRVVNAQGRISRRLDAGPSAMIQRLKLDAEGVEFDEQGRIPLHCYQWRAETPLSPNYDNGSAASHALEDA